MVKCGEVMDSKDLLFLWCIHRIGEHRVISIRWYRTFVHPTFDRIALQRNPSSKRLVVEGSPSNRVTFLFKAFGTSGRSYVGGFPQRRVCVCVCVCVSVCDLSLLEKTHPSKKAVVAESWDTPSIGRWRVQMEPETLHRVGVFLSILMTLLFGPHDCVSVMFTLDLHRDGIEEWCRTLVICLFLPEQYRWCWVVYQWLGVFPVRTHTMLKRLRQVVEIVAGLRIVAENPSQERLWIVVWVWCSSTIPRVRRWMWVSPRKSAPMGVYEPIFADVS